MKRIPTVALELLLVLVVLLAKFLVLDLLRQTLVSLVIEKITNLDFLYNDRVKDQTKDARLRGGEYERRGGEEERRRGGEEERRRAVIRIMFLQQL